MPIVANVRLIVLAFLVLLAASGARAGTVACWFDNGAIVVPAAFDDIAGDFLIDPSAQVSRLNVTEAESAGITADTSVANLVVAGERLPGLTMQVADLDALSRPFPAGIVGVIGADALGAFAIQITAAPCRVTLSRRPIRPRGVRLPLRRVGGAWAVPAAISDGVTTRSGWFAIDTAWWGARVAEARLTRDPPADLDPLIPPARLRALSLGGRLYEQAPAGLAVAAPAGLDGSIGEWLWSRGRLTLDPVDGWASFEVSPFCRKRC